MEIPSIFKGRNELEIPSFLKEGGGGFKNLLSTSQIESSI